MELVLLGFAIFAVLVLLPILALSRSAHLSARVRELERQVRELLDERRAAGTTSSALAAEAGAARATSDPPVVAAPASPPTPDAAALATPSAVQPTAFTPAPAPLPSPAPAIPMGRSLDATSLEQLIGSVWLQNLGAVLVLLGVFLMILWGYTTGRVGPRVLVAGGVALGLVLTWRGDRVARRMPAFGHALVGLGLGAIYVTLFLGFIRLHVFDAGVALALLVLVSLGSIGLGLRYRVQLIAALGVVGAFLPQFMANWLGLSGFEMTPLLLFAYLAVVDTLVFALAAKAGWSALNLSAIVLSACAWMSAFHTPAWGWPTQIGLSALFTLLGLAPLPRLVRVEGRVRPLDLAVIASAPLAMLAASAPFLDYAARSHVAMLLMTLALVMIGAVLWVDSRRPERDLWIPLTAAATLFLSAALERALGPVYTGLAWSVEGLVLLRLGLRERGGWLRVWGSAVLLTACVVWFVRLDAPGWTNREWPILYAAGLRDLLVAALVLFAGGMLNRARARLSPIEQRLPSVWTLLGNLLLAVWLGVQSTHVASALVDAGGRFQPLPPPLGMSPSARRDALQFALMSAGWLVQSAALAWQGSQGRVALRIGSATMAWVALIVIWGMPSEGWWTDQRPVLHLVSILELFVVGVAAATALRVASRRDSLAPWERFAPEFWTVAASLSLMLWSAREAAHVAQAIVRPDTLPVAGVSASLSLREHTMSAALTSVAWLVQSALALTLGWLRHSAFMRWSGLALLGLTLLKFVLVDLQAVDVFWRFLTAILVGAAMLGLSFIYQRRARGATPVRKSDPEE